MLPDGIFMYSKFLTKRLDMLDEDSTQKFYERRCEEIWEIDEKWTLEFSKKNIEWKTSLVW